MPGPVGAGLRLPDGASPFTRSASLASGLQQRVALKLGVDVGGEVEVGELQQLDRLHELRRHHERLALPDFKSL